VEYIIIMGIECQAPALHELGKSYLFQQQVANPAHRITRNFVNMLTEFGVI